MTASVYAATDMVSKGMVLSNNEGKETIDRQQLDLTTTAGRDINVPPATTGGRHE